MKTLIGVAGFKRSGKDTVGLFLKEFLEESYCFIAFADTVKAIASRITGIPVSDFYSDEYKDTFNAVAGITPRLAMTKVYDGLKPVFGDDLFIKPVKRAWEATNKKVMVITDVRYENEAEWIRSVGGVILHVQRPGAGPSEHSSERGIAVNPADYVLRNDGSLDDLREVCASVVVLLSCISKTLD